jgi:hypothetical protein
MVSMRLYAVSRFLQAASGPYGLQQASQARQVATHELHVNLGPLTGRAAFSHVPFWQSAAAMVSRIVQRPTPGNPVAAPGSKAAGYEVLLLSWCQPSGTCAAGGLGHC